MANGSSMHQIQENWDRNSKEFLEKYKRGYLVITENRIQYFPRRSKVYDAYPILTPTEAIIFCTKPKLVDVRRARKELRRNKNIGKTRLALKSDVGLLELVIDEEGLNPAGIVGEAGYDWGNYLIKGPYKKQEPNRDYEHPVRESLGD